tara:strand:- start:284 stop:766 length:483 start_codon:yes stop_codon:yes gene_type:complete
MQVYSYDKETREYIGKTIAFESPLEKGVYHYPACTTIIPPLENTDKENKMVVWDIDVWRLKDRPPREKTIEEMHQEDIDNFKPPTPMELLRNSRNKRLKAVDWAVMRSLTTTGTIPEELKNYMQALRDLPTNSNPTMIKEDVMLYVLDDSSVVWPVKPSL